MSVNKKNKIFTSLLLLSIIFVGCSEKGIKEEVKAAKGSTRIIGRVVSIDKEKRSTDANSLCSKYPCWAEVAVDSVLSIGQGGPLLGSNDTLSVRFSFTLGETTKELFPTLKVRMAGLEINSRFVANVVMLSGKTDSSRAKYLVATYKNIN